MTAAELTDSTEPASMKCHSKEESCDIVTKEAG